MINLQIKKNARKALNVPEFFDQCDKCENDSDELKISNNEIDLPEITNTKSLKDIGCDLAEHGNFSVSSYE
jgi:hypothetical protein